MYIRPVKVIREGMEVPGDKSISHRAVMLSSIAKGESRIHHFLTGEDCLRTIDCFRKLGVEIRQEKGSVWVKGVGLRGLRESREILDVGNSGTTIRLMTGLLSAQPFETKITGDGSIQRRPMDRIISPLSRMGASIRGIERENLAPLHIVGKALEGIDYRSPIASAQVKSAVLLAGLYAKGSIKFEEPYPSRNHTELMLADMGVQILQKGSKITMTPPQELYGKERRIPGDISSAAFFMVLGTLVRDGDILLKDVGLNETRTGILDVLLQMGAQIRIFGERKINGERIGDIRVRSSRLRGIEIGGSMIPRLIDEIPILAVAACFAEGITVIKDAQELKVKESNRLKALVTELRKIGANIKETEDGMIIQGTKGLYGGEIHTYEDHRIAMAMTIAGMISQEGVKIDHPECVAISFPDFFDRVERMMGNE